MSAFDGEQALEAIAKQQPDLIPMDIQLPIIDGYTATRKIKANPEWRSIPIIAVTSYALSGEEKKAREAGCDDYVPKPFSPSPADSLALRFSKRKFLSAGAPASRAPIPFLFSDFLFSDNACGAGDQWPSGDRAAELGGRWQQHPA